MSSQRSSKSAQNCIFLIATLVASSWLASCGGGKEHGSANAPSAAQPGAAASQPPQSTAPSSNPTVACSTGTTAVLRPTVGGDGGSATAFWASQPIAPNETSIVSGDFTDDVSFEVGKVPDCDNSSPLETRSYDLTWRSETPFDQQSNSAGESTNRSLGWGMANFVVPADLTQGVFAYRMSTAAGKSASYFVNKPDLWFIQGDQGDSSTPGGWIQVHGTALALASSTRQPMAALVKDGQLVARLSPVTDANDPLIWYYNNTPTRASGALKNNKYRQRFAIPASVAEGTYELYVSNGHGGVNGWTNLADMQMVSTDEYASGAPTIHTIRTVEVRRQPMVTYAIDVASQAPAGAWEDRIQWAIDQAAAHVDGANVHGGIVKLPTGTMSLGRGLVIHAGVTLQGQLDNAGSVQTHLDFGSGWLDRLYGYLVLLGGSIENVELISHRDGGACIRREGIYTPAHVRKVTCSFPNLASTAPTSWGQQGEPWGGVGIWLMGSYNLEVSDSTFNTRTGVFINGQFQKAVGYSRFERNVFKWRDDDFHVRRRTFSTVFDDNNTIMLGTYSGNGYDHVDNGNPGTWIAAYDGHVRDVYLGNNFYATDDASNPPVDGHVGLTFDGFGGDYYDFVVKASGTHMWLKRSSTNTAGSVVMITSGKGAGQWRTVVTAAGTEIDIDRPWDVMPDAGSAISIPNFVGRTLIVNNDFQAKPNAQTYYATHDVVWADNTFGGTHHAQGFAIWTGDNWNPALNSVQPGWHIQVLDNSRRAEWSVTHTQGLWTNQLGFDDPLTRGMIFRNNSLDVGGNLHLSLQGHNVGHLFEGNRYGSRNFQQRGFSFQDRNGPTTGLQRGNGN